MHSRPHCNEISVFSTPWGGSPFPLQARNPLPTWSEIYIPPAADSAFHQQWISNSTAVGRNSDVYVRWRRPNLKGQLGRSLSFFPHLCLPASLHNKGRTYSSLRFQRKCKPQDRCVYTSGFRALRASKRLLVLLRLWKRDVSRFKRFSCVTGSMENGSHAALNTRCERRKLWWVWCPGRSTRPVSACISQLIKDTFRFKWSVAVIWIIYAWWQILKWSRPCVWTKHTRKSNNNKVPTAKNIFWAHAFKFFHKNFFHHVATIISSLHYEKAKRFLILLHLMSAPSFQSKVWSKCWWYFNLIWLIVNFNLFLVYLHCNVCNLSFSQYFT